MTTYAEFRVRIERGSTPRSYRVEASGLGGETPGRFRVPFSDTELENFVLKVGRTRRGVRRIESPEMELARAFGGRLFSAVMDEKVGELYRAAFTEAQAAGQGLRVTLSLTDVPELGAIPWEYLYDPPNFLSISTWTPVVRYLDLPKPRRALAIELPIRILGVVSAPNDHEPLNAELERAKLEDALRPLIEANAVSIEWLEKPNLLALARKLRHDQYHILHYIGHGGFDDASGEGALLFEDEGGRGRAVSGDQLATVLHGKLSLRLVLLNSCEGARNSVKDPFSGVAASLVEREVPAVIGMQFEITDRAAVLFAGEFYSMLAEGQPVDSAMAEARLAIFADHNDVEWGTPVLFMRVADGRLFDVANAAALPRRDPQELPSKVVPVVEDARPEPVSEPEPAAPEPEPVPEPEPAAPEPEPVAATAEPAAPEPVAEPVHLEPVVAEAVRADTAGATLQRGSPPATQTYRPEAPPAVPVAPAIPIEAPPQASTPARRSRIPWGMVAIGAVAAVAVLTVIGLLLPSTSTGSIQVSTAGALESRLVVVTGTGFKPGETVDISLDGYPTNTEFVAPDGSIRSVLAIGARTGGRVLVFGRESKNQASSDFTVPGTPSTPTASEAPPTASSGAVGSVAPASLGILFYSDVEPGSQEKDNELYVIDPVTDVTQQITFNGVEDTFPTWSPDYRQIAFTRDVDGSGDIFILEADGSERQLTSGPTDDYFPAWSKDGWIAFVRVTPPSADSAIWLIRSDGTLEQEALSGKRLRSPAWSPDGTKLAITADYFAPNYDVTVIQAEGLPLLQLTVGTTSDRNPTWSPDGRTIAFVKDEEKPGDGDNDIYLLDVATKTLTMRLTDNDVQDGNPVWSPDGTQIAFYRATSDATPPEGFHLWVINIDRTGERDLMPDRDGRNLDPNWR